MDEFEKQKLIANDYKIKREIIAQDQAREQLSNLVKSKVKTTMIGAINSIEQHLGFLWKHGSHENLSETEKQFLEIFQKLRTEILDKGNNQSRNIDSELSRFEVKIKKVNLLLPVRGNKENG